MVIIISGASHTGKTKLAQDLLEKYKYPYLSVDHIKMGLIRSGNTDLTPYSDDKELTDYLWKIVREIIKTVIENRQNLIVEGCYIPFDWKKDFHEDYLKQIRSICLVMSEQYIRSHFLEIKSYARVIEQRLDDSDCTVERLISDNQAYLRQCRKYGLDYLMIETQYCTDIEAFFTAGAIQ